MVTDGAGTPGPPRLLLLHGYLGSAAGWDRVVRALGGDVDVRRPDLAGHGARSADGADLPAMLAPLLPLVTDAAPVTVVGHSMGAIVALALAAAEPRAVAGVGLVGLPVFADAESGYAYQASRGRRRALLMRLHRRTHPLCLVAARTFPAWYPAARAAAPRYPREALAGLFLHGPRAHAGALESVVFGGHVPTLARAIRSPVHVLHGSCDWTAPVDRAVRQAGDAAWPLALVPGADHHLLYDRPGTVARWIRETVMAGTRDAGERDQCRSIPASDRRTMATP